MSLKLELKYFSGISEELFQKKSFQHLVLISSISVNDHFLSIVIVSSNFHNYFHVILSLEKYTFFDFQLRQKVMENRIFKFNKNNENIRKKMKKHL